MTTTLEAVHHNIPDTHSSGRAGNYDIEVRPSGGHGVIQTSGLSQWPTVNAPVPDFRQLFAAEVLGQMFGLVDCSQIKSRVYLLKSLAPYPSQLPPAPRPPSVEEQARYEEHRQFLQRVSTEGKPPLITRATAKKSWDLWLAVRKAAGPFLPIPSAGTGPDGVLFYSWDKGAHHLEAEIRPDRDTEFFYRNRSTGRLWGEDHAGGALPADLLDKLSLFV